MRPKRAPQGSVLDPPLPAYYKSYTYFKNDQNVKPYKYQRCVDNTIVRVDGLEVVPHRDREVGLEIRPELYPEEVEGHVVHFVGGEIEDFPMLYFWYVTNKPFADNRYFPQFRNILKIIIKETF